MIAARNLWWIVPLCFILGFFLYAVLAASSDFEHHPFHSTNNFQKTAGNRDVYDA